MPKGKVEYRVMLHPSGEMGKVLDEQLKTIAKRVFGKNTSNVIYRIKPVDKQVNRRKIFIPGDGEIVEAELLPHMTLGQKIVMEEKDEKKVIQRMEEIVSDTKPFVLTSTRLGDYGEDFTIFVAFAESNEADKLVLRIREKMGQFSPAYEEKRDVLHLTLVYDDVSSENIERAWKVVEKDKLINKKLRATSMWLWKNHKPYKEFTFKTS